MILDSQGRVLVQSDGLSTQRSGLRDRSVPRRRELFSRGREHRRRGNLRLDDHAVAGVTPRSSPSRWGPYPDAIVAGDFTGDGRTDLAVANEASNDVSVLLGNGDGTFQPQVTYAVGSEPDAHRGGRLHRRRPLDLAVANDGCQRRVGAPGQRRRHLPAPGHLRGGDRARRHRGGRLHRRRPHRPGRRQLTATTTCRCCWATATAPSSPRSPTRWGSDPDAIVAGDFTGDGHTDLAVANVRRQRPCRCCWATATAPSSPRSPTRWGSSPDAIVAGDFTGDGRTDLAVANERSDDVSVLLGNGDGTFQPQVTYAVGSSPTRSWRATSTATAGPTWPSPTPATTRVGVAGQRRRHVPAPGHLRGGVEPDAHRGGRLHRRRPDSTWPSPTPATTPCRCCWATATAPSRPQVTNAVGSRPGSRSWRATSPATAAPTWPSPTTADNDRVGAAGQRRRHVPAPGHLRGGVEARRHRGG